ncbi:MAG: hypothetical protein WCQ72_08480, partial [Eubacteriales bacterium]
EYKTILSASDMITELPVTLSDKIDHVMLLPEHEIVLFMPITFDVENDVTRVWSLTSEQLEAPVEAGEEAGEVSLYISGEFVISVPLVTKSNVDSSQSAYIYSQIMKIVRSRVFIAAVVIAAVLLVLYVLLVAYLRGKAQQKRLAQRRRQRRVNDERSGGDIESGKKTRKK